MYHAKNYPDDWFTKPAPAGDGEAAYGYSAADSFVSVCFIIQ